MKRNYVIAKEWGEPFENELCCYMEMSCEVFHGTVEQAKAHARIISKREGEDFFVYLLETCPVK